MKFETWNKVELVKSNHTILAGKIQLYSTIQPNLPLNFICPLRVSFNCRIRDKSKEWGARG